MRLLVSYIQEFLNDPLHKQLGTELERTRQAFDVHVGMDARSAFQTFVDRYNWLGDPATKAAHNITQNLARNVPGALMQDYMIHIVTQCLQKYPTLDIFTEVPIPYGTYPRWANGQVTYVTPTHLSDLAVGNLMGITDQVSQMATQPWPRQAISRLPLGTRVMPLIVISSKIRVSQGEFFDFVGRDQLMTKGNPNCLDLQVALRAEMNLNIVHATGARDKFFLIGHGGERSVVRDDAELDRLILTIETHLQAYM